MIPKSRKDSKRAHRAKHQHHAKTSTGNVPVNDTRPDILVPTPEYLAHRHGPTRHEKTGGYRVVDALERLFTRGLLDSSGAMNEAMYLSALWLRETFRRAGFDISLSSGDLDRIVTGRSDFSDRLYCSDRRIDAQNEFADAVRCMGWYAGQPFRGAGRITVGVVCYGYTIAECVNLGYLNQAGERAEAVAIHMLREGLMSLAGYNRRISAPRGTFETRMRAFRDFRREDLSL